MKFILLIIILLYSSFSVKSQNTDIKFEITHGPYIQNLTINSVSICWSVSIDAISWVEFYAVDGSNFYQEARKKVFNSSGGLKNISKLHIVELKNLKPNTKYAYRIYSQEVNEKGYFGKIVATRVFKREPYYFTTLDEDVKEVSFIVLSDIHERPNVIKKLLQNTNWENKDFVLLNGDFVNWLDDEMPLYGIIDACVDIFAKETPIYIARGNHEARGALASKLNQYFHFKNNSYYYTFSYGSTYFIVLDSGEDKADSDIEYYGKVDFDSYRDEQVNWLSGIVQTSEFKNAKHKIVIMHIPAFGDVIWHTSKQIQKKIIPILNKSNISLMINGHFHINKYFPKEAGRNNFPIILSDNNSRADVFINNKGIKVTIVDIDSNIVSEHFFSDD